MRRPLDPCTAWTVTFGIEPGYRAQTHPTDVLSRVTHEWQSALMIERRISGVIVSGVASESRAVYHPDHGCPLEGETTVTVSGASNPSFDHDHDAYREALLRVVEYVQASLDQTTVRLVVHEASSYYLRRAGAPG